MSLRSLVTIALLTPLSVSFCPPPGPLLPPPVLSSTPPNFTIPASAFSNLTFNQNTSYVIKASIGDTTVFENEHSAPGREVSQSLLNTTIRIASATKMITALALVLSADKLSLEDSITQYIPALNNSMYKDVTIAALADHTSGLGRFGYVGDLIYPGQKPSALGLPIVPNTLPGCDPVPGGRVCTADEVIAMFNDPKYAPHSPNSGPLYSNIAYILLGRALEAVHNKTYESIIQDLILDPAGMEMSTFIPPTNNQTAILPRFPWDASWFVAAFGNLNAVGGLWSTPNDMLKLLQALQRGDLMSKAKLRGWMKPRDFLTSPQQYTGVAWEILRPTDLAVNFSRPIEIWTKAGGVPGYASYAVLVPEYNIALTINLAGGSTIYTAAIELLAIISETLIPYADTLARTQASAKYAGTYVFKTANVTNTLTLSANNGPGLSIDTFTVNNVDVLLALAGTTAATSLNNFSARLYPTDPDSLGTAQENWRLLQDQRDTVKGFAELGCASWNFGDWGRYNGRALDTFVFEVEEGKVRGVELEGWGVRLEKLV
ncbi:beta-lactamase/transpeptidase-like protein [Plenodomus tracheiphilus IPT5]|uniref:Beta-lactamase/transpeptidase-like protein n=1 Tax=Plenodomus tracheiphilus IPT5 TaxID=1408161 RepID=A0A6A7BE19_9PLEO|nr:beta-lactamase/transpeptidase-like protein [Plenodomus tracheiphilus IPT5]